MLITSQPSLDSIIRKVEYGERLTLEDGLTLFESNDIATIGQLANLVNTRKNGNNVYFIQNRYLNPTNVCNAHCSFCGFRRDPGEDGAYTMTHEEIVEAVRPDAHKIREVHIVGGHNHTVPFSYYVETVRVLKTHFPHIAVKAYTGAEIQFFSELSGKSVEAVLAELKEAGLDSLTGGGAEILSERYRQKVCSDKATVEQWLNAHRTAHKMGIKTHATMLYGLIETYEERLQHMLYLREIQDETGGFLTFIPLAYQPRTYSVTKRTAAFDDLKTIAISRLMLDNFDHIKAYWIDLGTKIAQVALGFGADDLHGTLIEEKISHAVKPEANEMALTVDELVWLIKSAGRTPVERDTFYNPIRTF
ncbi:aminodeoxyfutalosine synthase [Collibacillus ludicampi]|jgi:aminodeoxyfutalosine synthase|uniref:Aminodeoxyfutalosine synthase n=1 Tax=Collibacillus ludicampi TaxID=2771369 RepID=A0AAV4LAW8_9BACL|nr:aminofutalosine synthase MqnE [Collibacillus ludicampi]GIM44918.1 aminodeoxyfutalosine synthase [Collibacillus ludicampi]